MLRFCFLLTVCSIALASNYQNNVIEADNYQQAEKVDLKLFYESLCPDCIAFDPVFVKAAKKLWDHINVNTYPYGNAQMTPNQDGSVTVDCQHGEPECYGNKLHACAIDVLGGGLPGLNYNGCMMAHRSNDSAADKCGKIQKVSAVNVKAIKDCANGPRGQELLINYGKESELVNFNYVPYVLVNGNVWNGEPQDFLKDVCAAFSNPPRPCPRAH